MVFPDQSHIDRVRDALWSRTGARASVMVGSGFSKNAEKFHPSAGEMPLLSGIVSAMTEMLYPSRGINAPEQNEYDATSPTRDVLRLAQEYETAFGQGELYRFLQRIVGDEDHIPGDAHIRLLQLPWRDIFTTNWDTLLERSRDRIKGPVYDLVENMGQIPMSKQPRIFKLHGSFPAQPPFIFTEEEYRTYPAKFAPFVNTVQQAIMETVFLLLGFSGEDPNFLKWTGWVRDNLGPAAPKIYLAGHLRLSPHQRRRLEDLGVVPIDLALHPKVDQWPDRYASATQWILHTLEQGRPYDIMRWPVPENTAGASIPEHLTPVVEMTSEQPKKEERSSFPNSTSSPADKDVEETLTIWTHNRALYPGWLIFASGQERSGVKESTDLWEPEIARVFADASPIESLNAIREIAWRREILIEPISSEVISWADKILGTIDCENCTIQGLPKQLDWDAALEAWIVVSRALLTNARLQLDHDSFFPRLKAMSALVNRNPEVTHLVMHERCLWFLSEMNFGALEEALDDWQVGHREPLWKMRKSAILEELGRSSEAEKLAQEALSVVQEIDNGDMWVSLASLEGWAMLPLYYSRNGHTFRKRWAELAPLKCDAWTELEHTRRALAGGRAIDEPPPFDLGITQRRRQRPYRAYLADAAYRAIRLSELAGLPPTKISGNLLNPWMASGLMQAASEGLAPVNPELAIRLALRSCRNYRDRTLQRVLSRPRVARIRRETAESLVSDCDRVVDYALSKIARVERGNDMSFWLSRVSVAIEIQSRLVVRLSHDVVESVVNKGIGWNRNLHLAQSPRTRGALSNLLSRSIEALTVDRLRERFFDLLDVHFPETYGETIPIPERTSKNNHQWEKAVRDLSNDLVADSEARMSASQKLFPLVKSGKLTPDELNEIGNALWDGTYTRPDHLPEHTVLPDWTFLMMPEPNPGVAEQCFRRRWLESGSGNSDSREVLLQVGDSLKFQKDYGYSLEITDDERKYIGEAVGQWLDEPLPQYSSSFPRHRPYSSLSPILDVMPSILSIIDAGSVDVDRLFGRFRELTSSGIPAHAAASGFAELIPHRVEEIVEWLRIGLVSEDEDVIDSSFYGLFLWLMAAEASSIANPPIDLVREIGLTIAARKRSSLASALQIAKWVFEEGTIKQQKAIEPLVTIGLNYLIRELRYGEETEDELDLPLLRLCSTELAKSMNEKGYKSDEAVRQWLEVGGSDPLAEVRNVVTPTYLGTR